MLRISTVLFTLVLTTVAWAQASSAPDRRVRQSPEQLIQRWMEVSGGNSAYDAMTGRSRTWMLTFSNGGEATINGVADAKGRYFVMTQAPLKEKKMIEASNGQGAWLINEKGQAKLMTETQQAVTDIVEDPLWGRKADKIFKRMATSTSKQQFGGELCWQVIGLLPNRNRIELFFSVESGQWKGLEYLRKRPGRETTRNQIAFSDFREQDGFTVPFTFDATDDNGGATGKLTKLEFNPKIPADTFNVPDSIRSMVPAEPVGAASQATGGDHGKLIGMIGPEVVDKNGRRVSSSALGSKNNVLLYFSASWCPPCKRFTPGLVEFFNKNAEDKNFTIVFVSSDRSQDAMLKYMKDYNMDFWAVPFDRVNPSGLKTVYGDRGIPNLVWLNAADEAVAKSYVDGNYVGPNKVLSDFGQSMGVN